MNLQQKEDVYGRDFNLKEMKKIYQKFGICLKKFQIRDNFPDLTAKILPAAFFLNDLIQEYGVSIFQKNAKSHFFINLIRKFIFIALQA